MAVNKKELDKLIQILVRRCNLGCTNDDATNIMTYDSWLDDVLEELNDRRYRKKAD